MDLLHFILSNIEVRIRHNLDSLSLLTYSDLEILGH